MTSSLKYLLTFYIFVSLFSSCNKQWLNVKPNSQLVVLSTLSDYQELEDNPILYSSNALPETGSDDYYIPVSAYPNLSAIDFAEYIWAPNGYGSPSQSDWSNLYSAIYTCNTVLDGLSNINRDGSNQSTYDVVKGTAYYFRAYDYYELAQTFCKPFDSATSSVDFGSITFEFSDSRQSRARNG